AWSNFVAGIRRDRSRLVAFTQGSASGRRAAQRAQLVRRIFRHANTISQFHALLNGDVTTSTFTATLSSFSDFAERRGASYLATRAVAVKNMIDVYEHGSGFADRLGVGDYDAALGRGLCLAAGVTELGYIIATGTTLGGPVGAVVSIIAVVGAVIIIFATDSEEELFMRHCLWGTQPRREISRRDWMTTSTTMWANSTMGVRWQLESLINLLHKYDVRHNYQNLRFMGVISNVLALDILTRFLPDTVRFEFRGRFTQRGGRPCQVYFDVRFPPRVRPRADRDSAGAFRSIRFRRSGPNIVRGVNAQVFTESGRHRIRLHIAFTDGVTEENGWDGEAWLKCFPFGHTDFSAPHGRCAFHLENLISHDSLIINHWRDYSFEADEWAMMPTWRV
ncbi:MAG: hypothetical protein JSU69_01585, partial [Candidatus Zixiibacteriota bacterium]